MKLILLLERKYGLIVKQHSHWDFLVKFTAVDVVVCLWYLFLLFSLSTELCSHMYGYGSKDLSPFTRYILGVKVVCNCLN